MESGNFVKQMQRYIYHIIITIVHCLCCCISSAQFYEDFSDPDLLSGVQWTGDLDSFAVIDGTLQLQATESGSSSLSTSYTFTDSLRFGIDVRLDFAPSADNQLKIFLFHADGNMSNGEALFLELGESGSADAFVFYHRDDFGVENEIHRFASIPHNSSRLSVTVQIEYIGNDNWEFYFDHGSNGIFEDKQSVSFNFSPEPDGFFGLSCMYTKSRIDKFFFDDIFIEKIVPDKIPPDLINVEVLSGQKLRLIFDEDLDGDQLTVDQFRVIPGNIIPSSVVWNDGESNVICLQFANALDNLVDYSIQAMGILDVAGNLASTLNYSFFVLIPELILPGDIIINEIHAAPSSSTLVVNAEFIELHNRSDKILNIGDITLRDASSAASLPQYFLFPDEYIVITDEDELNLFEEVDTVVGVASMPALNNGGDDLSLHVGSELIDRVSYTSSWYGNDDKISGWSLECKNPESLCRGEINWSASVDPTGGTPGEINSIFTPDEPPGQARIKSVQIVSPFGVKFTFDIEMNQDQLMNTLNYVLTPSISVVAAYASILNGEHVLELEFDNMMELGEVYTISFNSEICSCNGQKWDDNYTYSFGRTESPAPGDVRISEILFAPFTGEAEFVEIINTSQKIIDVNDIWLHFLNADNGFVQRRIEANFQLLPGEYHVITQDKSSILDNYHVPFPDQLHFFDLPILTNSGGILTLFYFDDNQDSVFIDNGFYSIDLYDPLLDRLNGISLERLRLNQDGLQSSNWYSASTQNGGATPTGENSQRVFNPGAEDVRFSLTSPTFSPDGDGYEDVMVLLYEFDEPGFIAQAKIFSYDGVLIKNLLNNESLGTSGQILWSGETNDGERARVGVYYILIKAFQVGGKTIEEKIKVVLARRL